MREVMEAMLKQLSRIRKRRRDAVAIIVLD
jgi:hypothetical protein